MKLKRVLPIILVLGLLLSMMPLSVAAATTLSISKQPKNIKVLDGEEFSFTITAKGDGVKYQWYIKDTTSKSYSKSSIKTNTYTAVMNDTRDGRRAYCVVSDQYGNKVKSNVVQATKNVPKITKQPTNAEGYEGDTLTTSLKATGDGLTYTWYVLDRGAEDYVKSAKTTSYYNFIFTKEKSGRKVYCVVTDKYGQSVTSDVAEFSFPKPIITKQPKDSFVNVGATASATVEVLLLNTYCDYQWYVKDVGQEEFVVSSNTSKSYRFTMTREKAGRQIYCVITNGYGESVQTDTVTMGIAKPKFTTQPKNADCKNGETIAVSAKATGLDLSYQWFYKNPGSKTFYASSIKTDTYSYQMTSSKSGRQVYCVVTDAFGNTAQSNTVTLRISAPEITVQPQNDTAKYGATVSASVKAIGDGLKYQWYFCNPGDNVFYKSSIKTATYSYTMTAEKDGRKAYCLITDKYGQKVQSKTVTFKKNTTLKITQQPVEAVAYIGDAASVTVKAQGDGLKYQWYFCNPGDTMFRKSSVTTATYSFEMTFEKTGRKVYCIVTDKHGDSVQSKTVVMRTIRPKITMQPTVVHDVYNKDLYVVVDAQGYEMTCEWYICEVGSSTFKKSSITGPIYYTDYTADVIGRRIYCIVTDCFGYSATSDTIVLDPDQTEFIPMYE